MQSSRQVSHVVSPAESSLTVWLTQRQFVVLVLYVGGFTAKQAAVVLGLELNTLSTYRKRIRAKIIAAGLPAHSRVDFEHVMREHGVLVLRPDGSVVFVRSFVSRRSGSDACAGEHGGRVAAETTTRCCRGSSPSIPLPAANYRAVTAQRYELDAARFRGRSD